MMHLMYTKIVHYVLYIHKKNTFSLISGATYDKMEDCHRWCASVESFMHTLTDRCRLAGSGFTPSAT